MTADPALVDISSSRVRKAVATGTWSARGGGERRLGEERTQAEPQGRPIFLRGLVPESIEEVVVQLYSRAKVTEG